MKPFSAKVKLYSKYLDQFPAPYGLNTRCKLGSQMEKWLHFPADRDINFQLRMLNDKTLQIRVVSHFNNEVTLLEDITTKVVPDNMYVQFSVKSPAVACKYLSVTDNQLFINRFQITLGSDTEFLEVYQILQHLKFRLKCGRTMPSSNLVPTGRFHDVSAISANNSHFGMSQDIIHSQVFEDPNHNAYLPRGYSHAPVLQAHGVLPSATCGPEGRLSYAQIHTTTPVEVIPDSQQRVRTPSSLVATPNEPNNERQSWCDTSKEVVGPQPRTEMERITDCKDTKEPIKPAQTCLVTGKSNSTRQSIVPDGINMATNKNNVANLEEKEMSFSEDVSEKMKDPVVADHRDEVQAASAKAVEPEEAIEDRRGQSGPHRRLKKRDEDNMTPKKISKKLIREKLRDRTFMKWVSKVERALETMSAVES